MQKFFSQMMKILNSCGSDDEKVLNLKNMGVNLDPPEASNPRDPKGGDEISDRKGSWGVYGRKEFVMQNASDYPKTYYFRHMEKGLCRYDEENITVLLNDPALLEMMPTLVNKPLYIMHKDIYDDKPENLEHNMHGVVADSFYNKLDAWYWSKIIVFTDEANQKIADGWLPSNSYRAKSVDRKPGISHDMKYDGEILSGVYDHIALIPEPRYEGCMILTPSEYKEYNTKLEEKFSQYQNSKTKKKEKIMGLKFWKKQEVNNVEELKDSFAEVNGKNVSFEDLKTNFQNESETKNAHTKIEDMKQEVEVDGKQVSFQKLADCWSAKQLNLQNESEKKEEKDKKEKKEAEEGDKFFHAMQNAKDSGQNSPKEEVKYDSLADKLKRGSEY